MSKLPYIPPFVELGGATWIVEQWEDLEPRRTKQPQSLTLRRLDSREERLLMQLRNDHECYAWMMGRAAKPRR